MRPRGFVSNLYRTARLANDLSAVASGKPYRVARRARNFSVAVAPALMKRPAAGSQRSATPSFAIVRSASVGPSNSMARPAAPPTSCGQGRLGIPRAALGAGDVGRCRLASWRGVGASHSARVRCSGLGIQGGPVRSLRIGTPGWAMSSAGRSCHLHQRRPTTTRAGSGRFRGSTP